MTHLISLAFARTDLQPSSSSSKRPAGACSCCASCSGASRPCRPAGSGGATAERRRQLRAAQSTMAALVGRRPQSRAWSCKRSGFGPRLGPHRSSFLTSWCGAKGQPCFQSCCQLHVSLGRFYTALCKIDREASEFLLPLWNLARPLQNQSNQLFSASVVCYMLGYHVT